MLQSILFVDDNYEVRTVMEELLTLEGYIVFGACDGTQALELVKAYDFDLLITDMRMPDMDGNQLIEALSNLAFSNPVIVLTGNIYSVAPNPLITEVAYKPISIQSLVQLVERTLFSDA